MKTDAEENEYERRIIRGLMPEVIGICDRTAAALAYRAEYEHAKEAYNETEKCWGRAAYGFTKAYWYARRDEPLKRDNLPNIVGDSLTALLKMAGTNIMGPDAFHSKLASLRQTGGNAWVTKARNAKKNYYRERLSETELETDALILTLWFPAMLWLMNDSVAVQFLPHLRNCDGIRPLKNFSLKSKWEAGDENSKIARAVESYGRARRRLRQFGLLSYRDFFGKLPPISDCRESTGSLVFESARLPGGFNFRAYKR